MHQGGVAGRSGLRVRRRTKSGLRANDISASLSASFSAFPSGSLSACLSAFLSAFLSASLSASLSAFLSASLSASLSAPVGLGRPPCQPLSASLSSARLRPQPVSSAARLTWFDALDTSFYFPAWDKRKALRQRFGHRNHIFRSPPKDKPNSVSGHVKASSRRSSCFCFVCFVCFVSFLPCITVRRFLLASAGEQPGDQSRSPFGSPGPP